MVRQKSYHGQFSNSGAALQSIIFLGPTGPFSELGIGCRAASSDDFSLTAWGSQFLGFGVALGRDYA